MWNITSIIRAYFKAEKALKIIKYELRVLFGCWKSKNWWKKYILRQVAFKCENHSSNNTECQIIENNLANCTLALANLIYQQSEGCVGKAKNIKRCLALNLWLTGDTNLNKLSDINVMVWKAKNYIFESELRLF